MARRCVAAAWLDNYDEKNEVKPIDGDPFNIRASNLEVTENRRRGRPTSLTSPEKQEQIIQCFRLMVEEPGAAEIVADSIDGITPHDVKVAVLRGAPQLLRRHQEAMAKLVEASQPKDKKTP